MVGIWLVEKLSSEQVPLRELTLALLTSACIKVRNFGLGPHADQTAEMVTFHTKGRICQ